MSSAKRVTLQARLLLSFGAVVLLLLILGIFAITRMSSEDSRVSTIASKVVPATALAGEATADMYSYRELQYHYILATPAERNTGANALTPVLKTDQEEMTAAFKQYTDEGLITDAKDRTIFTTIENDWNDYLSDSAPYFALSVAGKVQPASVVLSTGTTQNTFLALKDEATTWVAYENQLAKEAAASSHSTYKDAVVLTIILMVIALLVAIAIAVLISRRIVGGVREIGQTASAIARGEFDQEIHLTGNDELTDMADEFRTMIDYLSEMADTAARIAERDLSARVIPKSEKDQLGTSFARMITNLRAMIADISERTGSLSAASNEMAATSEETGRAIQEIATAVGNVAQGAERQVHSVEEARQVSDQLAEATRLSAETADETAAAAEEARNLAREGVRAAEQASEAMISVRDSSVQTSQAIKTLGQKSDQIGGIVETISGIAAQTNLLALNAAIEAARAGDHGRGFAVVAEEVRHLAEESQQAAASIGGLIDEIQNETQRTVQVVETGASQTEGGVETVEQARDAFMRIGQSVEDMSARVEQIADSIRQIAASGDQMRATMSTVAEVAESSSASTEEVSASTEQSSASTQEIAASAQQLANTAEALEDLVGKFVLS
jgi:methyl-accepting chemotaxis protein